MTDTCLYSVVSLRRLHEGALWPSRLQSSPKSCVNVRAFLQILSEMNLKDTQTA